MGFLLAFNCANFASKLYARRLAGAASGVAGPVPDDDVDPVERMYSPA
jgi:hypothetical protein